MEASSRPHRRAIHEIGLPFWVAITAFGHASWLASRGHDAEAEPLRAEAREIFERLGARMARGDGRAGRSVARVTRDAERDNGGRYLADLTVGGFLYDVETGRREQVL